MKNQLYTLFILTLLLGACQDNKKSDDGHAHDHSAANVPAENASDSKKSIPQEAHGNVGDAHLSIYFHSPAVRNRVIWGGLVPYGDVWVSGAHNATSIEFSKAIQVEGTTVPKGKYAFFTIPGKECWTLILNKNWEQHLADDYNQEEDVIRIVVTPETELPHNERLTYAIVDKGDGSGAIRMTWEKLSVSLPFRTD